MGGFCKDFFRLIELDHLSQQEEAGKLGDPRRLLHVVGHDHNGIPFFKLKDQLFYFAGGDWIERRARLVHEQDFRFDRQRPRDAKPLLLPTRETRAGFLVDVVLHFLPQRRRFQ